MANIVYPVAYIDGQTLPAVNLTNNFLAITAQVNGSLDNSNISASAAIALTKLDLTTQAFNKRGAGNNTWASGVTGDTNPRVTMTSDGYVTMGAGGASSPDVGWQRSSANTMRPFVPGGGTPVLDLSAASLTLGAISVGALTCTSLNLSNGALTNGAAASFTALTATSLNLSNGALTNGAAASFTALTATSLNLGTTATILSNLALVQNVRLYLTTGAPAANGTDVTTNFYVGPYQGNIVSLPNGSGSFTEIELTEITTALPSDFYRIYDIFLYNNSGTPTVEMNAWDSGGQSTNSITGVTAANPAVLTCNNSWSAGDLIGIAGITGTIGTSATNGLNGKVWRIASRTATTITLEAGADTSGLAYTAGGTAYKIPTSRTDGLTFGDGVYTKTGAATRLYIGTMMVGADGVDKQAQDNAVKRLVWNYFNRLPKNIYTIYSGTTSHTYSTATERPFDNVTTLSSAGTRAESLVGLQEDAFLYATGSVVASTTASTGTAMQQYIAYNTILASSNGARVGSLPHPQVANIIMSVPGIFSVMQNLGYEVLQLTEIGNATGTNTWYSNSGGSNAAIIVNGRW